MLYALLLLFAVWFTCAAILGINGWISFFIAVVVFIIMVLLISKGANKSIKEPNQNELATKIVDEIHENSLDIDFDNYVKICNGCGSKLLAKALTCPDCKRDVREDEIYNKDNKETIAQKIREIKASPNKTLTTDEIANQPVKCPHCNSQQLVAGQRGYSLVTGFIGASNVRLVCAKCGHKWKPGSK